MYRNEYPRPDFVRKDWACLNGTWGFEFDDNNIGMASKWYKKDHKLTKKINVPFVFQSKLSDIDTNDFHDFIWYKRNFKIESSGKIKIFYCISELWITDVSFLLTENWPEAMKAGILPFLSI